jgi:cell division protein ZapA
MSVHSTLDIQLRGKDYRVTCTPDEREALQAAVEFLDGNLAEISALTRSTGERLAVMTALNIAHELLALRQAPSSPNGESPVSAAGVDDPELQRRIKNIEARLDTALAGQQQEGLF